MKNTLSIQEAVNTLLANENNGWSRKEAYALATYYELLGEDIGEAVTCGWISYSNMQEVRDNYPTCPKDDEEALEWLYDCAEVIIVDDEALLVTEF